MTLQDLAANVGIDPSDLDDLENGYALEVDRKVLENIAQLAGVYRRGSSLTDDRLLDIFMCATVDSPPRLFQM
jgi:transcriptional regulator with XRE-family HTH domain